ncbi:kinesin-like protein KIF20B [Copidosoma floridanum]|uniref:kinesin-like protein KIF20B n=1 Tax=Copidosoma floridanum TaxID=29053 RepID=UPI0006C9B3AD|nr:kinesin-like protein KIF20B [Copidosoma floridanum]
MEFLLSTFRVLSDSHNAGSEPRQPDESPPKTEIFLRIRPNDDDEDVYSVEEEPPALLVKSKSPGDSARRCSKPGTFPRKRFAFSRIFNAGTDQRGFFEGSVEPSVLDLLNGGRSSTVIGYGTADSGKTYGLFGTAAEPGVVPRAIELVYSSLTCTLVPWYKPQQFGGAILHLSEAERVEEVEAKEQLLASRLAHERLASEVAYRELEASGVAERSRDSLCKDALYSVWVSFIEIYNDTIYDLLSVDEGGRKAQLKLAADKHGSTYVQGMRSVCASTGVEANEILCVGQGRLSTVATTVSGYKSSRSHSVFIVKLLEYGKDAAPAEVKMASLVFYDLAGPGRIQKSAESGVQQRESRSINTSLLALGRCFKIASEDQSRQSVGSFRESKLTRILQRSFRDRENILLLVNLNPKACLLAETQNILNFASTAMKMAAKEDRGGVSSQGPSSAKGQEANTLASAKVVQEREINDLVWKNQQLLAEVTELRASKIKREFEIRQELTGFYSKQIHKLEENWNNRMRALVEEKDAMLKFSVGQVENYYRGKLEEENGSRRRANVDRGDCEESFDTSKESLRNSSCTVDLPVLKRCFRDINQLVDEKNHAESENFKLDDEVLEYMSNIRGFIEESLGLKKSSESTSKGTQCSLSSCMVKDFLLEIQQLLDPCVVRLPEIDDSQDDVTSDNLMASFSRTKGLLLDNVVKTREFERENADLANEINDMNERMKYQDGELLQLRLQYQESEAARLLLSNKLEDAEARSESEKMFKNLDFDSLSMFGNDHAHPAGSSIDEMSQLELSLDKVERSSSETSKNDSGVASSIESACKLTDEKSCQTDISCETRTDFSIQERLVQLKLDYKHMKSQHIQETLKVTELSQELDHIKEAMVRLKENATAKEQTVKECQDELRATKLEIERLNEEKRELEMKCDGLTRNLLVVKREHESKLVESQVKLKAHEESESIASKCLESYWEKSVNLGSELSIAYSELEKNSIRCYREHVLRIGKLERELGEKRSNESKLKLRLAEYEKDLAGINELSRRANSLERLFERARSEKAALQRLLDESSSFQVEVQEQLDRLVARVAERDGEILLLKADFDAIVQTNLSNSKRAKELGQEVVKLMDRIRAMKVDILESEESRKALEKDASAEIDTLRARLKIFKENVELLNIISSNSESDELRCKLLKKQEELDFFKKNRNATIQRYENLVRQLQDALKMNTSSRAKKKSPYLRKSSGCSIYGSERQSSHEWKFLADEHASSLLGTDARTSYLYTADNFGTVVSGGEEPTRLKNDSFD